MLADDAASNIGIRKNLTLKKTMAVNANYVLLAERTPPSTVAAKHTKDTSNTGMSLKLDSQVLKRQFVAATSSRSVLCDVQSDASVM